MRFEATGPNPNKKPLPPVLFSGLSSVSADDRLDACVALGRVGVEALGTPGLLRVMVDRVNDADERVRLHAVGALSLMCTNSEAASTMGREGIAVALVGLLKHEKETQCRIHCMDLLCVIAEHWEGCDGIVESLLESTQRGLFFRDDTALKLLLICTDSNSDLCNRLASRTDLVHEFVAVNKLMMLGVLSNLRSPTVHVALMGVIPSLEEREIYFEILTNSVCSDDDNDALARIRADAYVSNPIFLASLVTILEGDDDVMATRACNLLDNVVQNATNGTLGLAPMGVLCRVCAQLNEEQNETKEQLADACSALLWSVFRRHSKTNINIDDLVKLLENHFLPQLARVNIVGILGIVASETQTSRLAVVLAGCSSHLSIMVAMQSADCIIDVFSDDDLDAIFRSIKMKQVLKALVPRFKSSLADRHLLADRETLENVLENLEAFIDYKK